MGLEARQTVRVANGQVKWSQPVERVPSAARNQSSIAMHLCRVPCGVLVASRF